MNPYCPVSPNQLLQRVADGFSVAASAMEPRWLRCCDQALDLAFFEVTGPLSARGIPPASIASWDAFSNVIAEQAMWHVGQIATFLADYKPEPFQRYKDKREYFATGEFAIYVSGQPVAPVGTGAVGGISFGGVSAAVIQAESHAFCAWHERPLPWWWARYPYLTGNSWFVGCGPCGGW